MSLLEIPHAILRDHETGHRHELISLTNTFVLMGREDMPGIDVDRNDNVRGQAVLERNKS